MAAELKQQGNAAYGQQRWQDAVDLYSQAIEAFGSERNDEEAGAALANRSAALVHLDRLEEALESAMLAAYRRPNWAPAQARCGETYTRLQNFSAAKVAYELAIKYATDDAARKRYQTSFDMAQKAAAKSEAHRTEAQRSRWEQFGTVQGSWYSRVVRAVQHEGFRPRPDGGLSVSLGAWEECRRGMMEVDRQVAAIFADGTMHAQLFSSSSLSAILDCILIDPFGFHMPNLGGQPGVGEKLANIIANEAMQGETLKYWQGRVWPADEIIRDLNEQIPLKGRMMIRRITTSLIQGRIIDAFIMGAKGLDGPAIHGYRLALSLLEEGNRQWAHEDITERGRIFTVSFVRNTRVLLMKALMDAHHNAKTPSAKRAFRLEEIERIAHEILDSDLPASLLATGPLGYRIAFQDLPRWEATACLAYCAADRAREPFSRVLDGKARFANLEWTEQAADLYDRAAEMMEDSWHGKRGMLWCAAEMWFRAGGLSVQGLTSRVDEARRIDAATARFFGPLGPTHAPRDLALFALQGAQSCVRSGMSPQSIIKPVPSVYLPLGAPESSAISVEEWERLSGDIGMLDTYRPNAGQAVGPIVA